MADSPVRKQIEKTIAQRLRSKSYYLAAAVRTGDGVTGLRMERIDASVPEVLRCVLADDELWSRLRASDGVEGVLEAAE